jgi:hypothetical protein
MASDRTLALAALISSTAAALSFAGVSGGHCAVFAKSRLQATQALLLVSRRAFIGVDDFGSFALRDGHGTISSANLRESMAAIAF